MGTGRTNSRQLAEVIERALADAGLSQRELAAGTGLASSTLNRRLKGSPFIYEELVAIGEFLDRPASSLIAEAEAAATPASTTSAA